MKTGFYPKLAWQGIAKNKKFYLPYLLTCVGMVVMSYIINYLNMSEAVANMRGGETIAEVLGFGYYVMVIFSAIFLFYTNSFIIKRRTKEFGLYNILGMARGNIAHILFWEYVIITAVSLFFGLFFGILFSKLFELGLLKMMGGDTAFSFAVSTGSVVMTALSFAVIFAFLLIVSIIRCRVSKPIELLRNGSAGEKPPRANWFFGVVGVCVLGTAYYIAVTIEDPVVALALFFVAVVMVIVATYLIFIAGSVVFCRILQKNKKYYYKSNHFVSVSQMTYRMKRNGAGLASICILATMVLVMLSSTASLFFGKEDSLIQRYPGEINVAVYVDSSAELREENISPIREKINSVAEENGAELKAVQDVRSAYFMAYLRDGFVDLYPEDFFTSYSYSEYTQICFFSLSDYNKFTDSPETLNDDEVLIYSYRGKYTNAEIEFSCGAEFSVKKTLDTFDLVKGDDMANVAPTIYIVTADLEKSLETLEELDKKANMLTHTWTYSFDTGLDSDRQNGIRRKVDAAISAFDENGSISMYSCEDRASNRMSFYSLFGGLFFLGIILSIVFIFAAVLIIYYKQVSEGYEDSSRFEIMQKVGMTKGEIRKSINSQLLTVFFMPLIGAGCHLAFAFPIIRKLLLLFGLHNVKLFITVNLASFLIFAVFYAIVYRVTSNAYYEIVSGKKVRE